MNNFEIKRIVIECIEEIIPILTNKILEKINLNKRIEEGNKEKDKFTDVHTAHCCLEHLRCKYGEEDTCTVCQGITLPDYPCNCEY